MDGWMASTVKFGAVTWMMNVGAGAARHKGRRPLPSGRPSSDRLLHHEFDGQSQSRAGTRQSAQDAIQPPPPPPPPPAEGRHHGVRVADIVRAYVQLFSRSASPALAHSLTRSLSHSLTLSLTQQRGGPTEHERQKPEKLSAAKR